MDPYQIIQKAITSFFARGTVTGKNGQRKMRELQVMLTKNETREPIEHAEPYGFSSEPHAGAESFVQFFSGDRSHGIALVVADRRYRPINLKDGEVVIFDDLGRKVYLSRAGITVEGVDSPVTVHTSASVEVLAPTVHLSGDLVVDGNITAKGQISDLSANNGSSMSKMRSTYNSHTHVHGDSSSNPPGQKM